MQDIMGLNITLQFKAIVNKTVWYWHAAAAAKSLQLCPTLCNLIDVLSRPAAFTAPAPGSLDAPWSLEAPGELVPVQAPAPTLELMPRYPQTS